MRHYKAVFFDVGGTLLDPYPSFAGKFANVCESLDANVSANDVSRVEKDIWKEVLKPRSSTPYAANKGVTVSNRVTGSDSPLGTSSPLPGICDMDVKSYASSPEKSKQFWLWFYKTFLLSLGFPNRDDIAVELYKVFSNPKTYKVFPDVIPFLEKITNYGLSMGVVSNWESWLSVLLEQCSIAKYFQTIAVSGEIGIEKPDKRIFEIPLYQLNVSPQDVVYIGDVLETDILPALEIGMYTVLIDRKGVYKNNNIPCMKINSLAELSPFFDNLF